MYNVKVASLRKFEVTSVDGVCLGAYVGFDDMAVEVPLVGGKWGVNTRAIGFKLETSVPRDRDNCLHDEVISCDPVVVQVCDWCWDIVAASDEFEVPKT